MTAALTPNEEAQLAQTIEMFEVITQSQPLDYQSLEILKEAYLKLGRQQEALGTAKRIASAYVQLGQLSSAILEYESILQAHPEDPDVQSALAQIGNRATNLPDEVSGEEINLSALMQEMGLPQPNGHPASQGVEDGREVMFKIFVDGRHLAAGEFDQFWPEPDDRPPGQVVEPFIQKLAERQVMSIEYAIKLIADRGRFGFLPMDKYDVDVELARKFPKDICQRWCVLPFDRMSKSLLVATANPFNKQAARELEKVSNNRLLWYLTPPQDLVKTIQRIFR